MPKHQQKIVLWIEKIWNNQINRNALLMAFRNSGKSTIVGLFCAWALYQNKNLRILVLAADSSLAVKMVRNVKHIIEKHPLTKNMKPEKSEEWASYKFTVNRDGELRDPSMTAKGIDANLTGMRADIIICDDVEVPNNCDSMQKRIELRQKLDELDYIITPCGMQLYVGTPHTFYTIYQTKDDNNKPEIKPYLKDFMCLRLPILNKDGKSVWPERFSDEKIASIRIRSGENKFISQMMLQSVNIEESRLCADNLLSYDKNLEIVCANGREILKIGDNRLITVSCWWDPAFGNGKNNDNSVIACVFLDENGKYYLHDLEYIKISDNLKDKNIADLQCEKVVAFLQRNYISAIHVEINGIGKFLPGILKQKLAEYNLHVSLIEEYSHQNKQQRIVEAFEVLLANKSLYAHKNIYYTGFIEEMREWGENKNCHDDALDAVAGCLSIIPIRLNKGNQNKMFKRQNWQGYNVSYSALTDFKI